MIKAKLTAPIIECELIDNRMVFYCLMCAKKHYHGLGEGHRVCHCDIDGNSPYLDTGYYLVENKKVVV